MSLRVIFDVFIAIDIYNSLQNTYGGAVLNGFSAFMESLGTEMVFGVFLGGLSAANAGYTMD